MSDFQRPIAIAMLGALAACSTAPVTPSIDTFGDAVADIVAADSNTSQARTLDARVNLARRKDFAARRVVYVSSDRGACDYTRPDLNTAYFDEVCQIVPQMLDPASDELITVASVFDPDAVQQGAQAVLPTSNTDLLREQLGFLLRRDLLDYSQSLSALAKASEPAEIGTAAASAYTAFTQLDDTINRSATATNSPAGQRRAARANLISLAATEALEAYRYRLLKRIVEDADVFVRQASTQLSILEFQREQVALDATNDRFIAGIDDQTPGSAQSLQRIEERFAAMAAADRNASFRRYADIGTTHSAILDALNAPGDLQRLAEATTRIRALVDAVRAVD